MIKQKIGIYLWGFSGITLAIGISLHPALTPEGMLEAIWVPVHLIILFSLFALVFALGLITYNKPVEVSKSGWIGFVLLNLSAFLFIGIVYFESFLIPILARDLPELFGNGLRIGPLKAVLPITALLFVSGHLFYGIGMIKRKLLAAAPFIAMIVFSAPLAFKPVLPDIAATIGAIGYGLSSVFFALQHARTGNTSHE